MTLSVGLTLGATTSQPLAGEVVLVATDRDSDEPINGALVDVLVLPGATAIALRTDSNGIARVPVPDSNPAPKFRITVRAGGHHPYHIALDKVGAATSPLSIPMRAGNTLRGQVTDYSGAAVAGVRVTTTDTADVSGHGYYYTLFDTQTNSDGRFEMNAVADAEKLRIEFSHPKYQTRWVSGQNDFMQVSLSKVERVSGVVADSRGAPIPGAKIATIDGDRAVASGPDGKFTLESVVGSPLQVLVSADQMTPQLVTLGFFDDPGNLNVRLQPGNLVTFNVTDHQGKPLPDVQVESRYWPRLERARHEGLTDIDGELTLRNTPEGYHEFLFHRTGYVSRKLRLQSKTTAHQVRLEKQTEDPIAGTTDTSKASVVIDIKPDSGQRRIMHYCRIDGTILRPLIADVELRNKYDRHGTPDISADGSTVAYDACPVSGAWDDSHIVVANVDGSEARAICWGVIPSLSPDGSHVAFSRPTKHAPRDGTRGQSIWTIRADGTNPKLISDNYAWGARWTADGRSIVFRHGSDENGNMVAGNCLRVYDLQTETVRNVFSPEESPFQTLRFQLNVSRRGRLAVVNGTLRDGRNAIAVIDIDRGLDSLQYVRRRFPNMTISAGGVPSISADNRWVGKVCRRDGRHIGYSIHINGTRGPRPFPRLPLNCHAYDPTYAPDGKHVILCIAHHVSNPW